MPGVDEKSYVFVSYSHYDQRWLARLKVHLAMLQREYNIDIWDDTRLTPSSKWKEAIKNALDKANAAILIVSPDFLASDFIATNELPPLLASAEDKGALILPVIAAPCLFLRKSELAQFQSVNDPSLPLLGMSENDQEATFLRVAETLLNKLPTYQVGAEQSILTESTKSENSLLKESFHDEDTWVRLVKIGGWIFDRAHDRIIGSGPRSYLVSRNEYGLPSFRIGARIRFSNFVPIPDIGMNAGIVFGFQSDRQVFKYYNICLTGKEIFVEKIGFKGGSEGGDYEHITSGVPLSIIPEQEYKFDIDLNDEKLTIAVDGIVLHHIERPAGVVGRVGLRPWRSQIECSEFIVTSPGSA